MANIKLINPKSGNSKPVEVSDDEREEFLRTVSARGAIAVDMDTGDILSRAPVPYSAGVAALEGVKTGLTAGIPLIGDEESRIAQAEIERQQPEALIGGKMAGEMARDVAMQLGLAAIRAPKALITAAPLATAALQGAAEEGDTLQQRMIGAGKGLIGSAVGEAAGRGVGAMVKAPLRAAGSAITDFLGRRMGLPIPSVATDPVVPTAVDRLRSTMGERAATRGQLQRAQGVEAALAEIEDIAAEQAAGAGTKNSVTWAKSINDRKTRVRQQLLDAGVRPDEIPGEITNILRSDDAAGIGKIQQDIIETIEPAAIAADIAAKGAVLPAAAELTGSAGIRAVVRGTGDLAVRPSQSRRQTTAGARYGTPDWAQQLQQAGVSPEMIADIEARMARLPGEATTEGISPMLRLQRPPVADDGTLRAAGSAARQLASGQLQILGQYYTRTQDPAVIPDMQRLGEWVGGVRK